MKENATFVLGLLAAVGTILGGVALQLNPIREEVHDIHGRLARVETRQEMILERLPPPGGRPVFIAQAETAACWRNA